MIGLGKCLPNRDAVAICRVGECVLRLGQRSHRGDGARPARAQSPIQQRVGADIARDPLRAHPLCADVEGCGDSSSQLRASDTTWST